MNQKIDGFLSWFRDEQNLENVRTSSTIIFVLLFVLYFYGFRTGFQLTFNDLSDLIIDMLVFIMSAIVVINDFTLRGIAAELREKDENREKFEQRHTELISKVNIDDLAKGLVLWNKKKGKEEEEKAKINIINRLEKKRRKYLASNDKKSIKKIKQFDQEIKKVSSPKYRVKFKYKPITIDDVLKEGADKKEKQNISVNYSPRRDTVMSQSSIVLFTVFFTNLLRFGLEPTIDSAIRAFIFLSILVPFLFIRAVVSYQLARNNVKRKYPLSIKQQNDILEFCINQ